MNGLTVPHDRWAERTVVACAIASRRGAELAAGRITADDIYELELRRLYGHAIGLRHLSGADEGSLAERIRTVALFSGVPEVEVQQLLEERPVMWDLRGSFAARVTECARRRAVMGLCAEIYNAIAAGARLDELAGPLRQLERTAS